MKDRLEEFISENREQFDMFSPDERLWKGIEARVSKQKSPGPGARIRRIGTRGILWRAAAVVVIFMISFALQEYLHRDEMTGKREKTIKTEILPELKEAEIYYTTLVSEKLSEIQPLMEEFPELGDELKNDLAELDSVYEDLKYDLADNIANDEVVEAMIQNYRLKLEILEDLQQFLQEQEASKNQDNESNEFNI